MQVMVFLKRVFSDLIMNKKNIIIASHRRSGTHLTIDSILNNFPIFNNNEDYIVETLDHLTSHDLKNKMKSEDLKKLMHGKSSLLKTHSTAYIKDFFAGGRVDQKYIENIFDDAKVIYVFRDGRDVLVSLYNYMKSFDKETRGASFHEFIRMVNNFDNDGYEGDVNRVEYWSYHVEGWLNNNDCLFLKFDEIKNDYEKTLCKISEFIGVPLNDNIVDIRRSGVEANANYFGRVKEKIKKIVSSNKITSVNFRKGVVGGWKEYFDDNDEAFFEEMSGVLKDRIYNAGD